MSDSAICVVELSVSARAASKRAKELTRWLLEREIIQEDESGFAPGPKARDATTQAEAVKKLANNSVDIVSERTVFHPGENYEPPACPKCAAPVDPDEHMELIGPWMEGKEPKLRCQNCRTTHPVGDYRGEFTVAVAELGVRFNNWGKLRPEFEKELKAKLGPRTRTIYERI